MQIGLKKKILRYAQNDSEGLRMTSRLNTEDPLVVILRERSDRRICFYGDCPERFFAEFIPSLHSGQALSKKRFFATLRMTAKDSE